MTARKLNSVNSKLLKCLNEIPEFNKLSPQTKGLVVDRIAKAAITKLMSEGGMNPEEDYIHNLSNSEKCADFVVVSKKGSQYLNLILEGKKTSISNKDFVQIEIPSNNIA
jgi:hypothetical protein